MSDLAVADADTMLGQLQRGRGAGFLRALNAPPAESDAALRECITHDPRWDHQVEERASYYAGLALAINLDLAWLARCAVDHWGPSADKDDDARWLVAPMLTCLAILGVDIALATLITLLEDAPATQLADAAFNLLDPSGELLSPRVPTILTARQTGAELAGTMHDLGWNAWRTDPPAWILDDPRLAEALRDATATTARGGGSRQSPTPDELLAVEAIRGGRLTGRNLEADREALLQVVTKGGFRALRLLAAEGDASAPLAVEIALEHPVSKVRVAGRRAVHALHGPEALSAARRWMALEDGSEFPYRAVEVIGNNGGPEDLPRLRQLAARFTEEGAMYRMCTAADALTKLRDVESVPWFRERFASTEYSWLRKRCAAALALLDAAFPTTLATECLWDCEPEARQAGAKAVSPVGREEEARLRELATSALETSNVKAIAGGRLADLGRAL